MRLRRVSWVQKNRRVGLNQDSLVGESIDYQYNLAMGPIALVDKSFLQALKTEQLGVFHKYYTILVTPILLEEILGNLVKSKYNPDEALRRVINLVGRANSSSSITVPDYRIACISDLLGYNVITKGKVSIFAGKEIFLEDGSKKILVEETFEQKLLRNWSTGNFSEDDKAHAGKLNKEFKENDLPGVQKEMQKLFPENKRAKSLEEIREKVCRLIYSRDNWEFIEIHARYCGVADQDLAIIRERWEKLGKPKFDVFAPYAFYTWVIIGVYFIGMTAGLVPVGGKAKSSIDLMYFYYLPFCQVFVSDDKFHRKFFPVTQANHIFLWGNELKYDIDQIASFHAKLDEKDRTMYEIEFGPYPPPILESKTREIWERFLKPRKTN